MRFLGWSGVIAILCSACSGASGGEDAGEAMDGARPDASTFDGGRADDAGGADDAGEAIDAAPSEDGGSAEDASASDAGGGTDACSPPPCPAPPAGCSYVGGDPCTCGTLECADAGCPPPVCPPPPPGCAYAGTDPCTCGTLVCAGDCGGTTCAATEYCDYFAPGACGGAGTCVPRPGGFCPAVYDPVCGCDGVDYGNSCQANVAGTDVASSGTCAAAGCSPPCSPPDTCQECRGSGGPVYVCLPPGVSC